MIITNDEILLRSKCEDVLPDEVGEIISKLEYELNNANRLGKSGIGLAAPQIGILKKAAIIRCDNYNIDLVNCNIEKFFDQIKIPQEGCLSFPTKLVDTMRYQEVYVVNNLIYPHSFICTGISAIACQHEIDHFNGKLFFDYSIKRKLKPNELCYCGSFLKFKKCCGKIS